MSWSSVRNSTMLGRVFAAAAPAMSMPSTIVSIEGHFRRFGVSAAVAHRKWAVGSLERRVDGDCARSSETRRSSRTLVDRWLAAWIIYAPAIVSRARFLAIAPASLEIEIMDRFGRPVVPREWFLVPLFVINDAVEKIRDGTITGYHYDPRAAGLKRISGERPQ